MPDLFGNDVYGRVHRSAEISPCGKYRWWLRRSWSTGGNGKVCCFITLNPSTADAENDDPTLRRCMAFVKAWGYSVLSVRNLFPYRATDPACLRSVADIVGPRGDVELVAAKTADLVVAAWGAGGAYRGRDKEAMALLAGKPLFCLRKTSAGHPQHPLYVRGGVEPIPY